MEGKNQLPVLFYINRGIDIEGGYKNQLPVLFYINRGRNKEGVKTFRVLS